MLLPHSHPHTLTDIGHQLPWGGPGEGEQTNCDDDLCCGDEQGYLVCLQEVCVFKSGWTLHSMLTRVKDKLPKGRQSYMVYHNCCSHAGKRPNGNWRRNWRNTRMPERTTTSLTGRRHRCLTGLGAGQTTTVEGGLHIHVTQVWTTFMRRLILTDLWPLMTCILSSGWLCKMFIFALMLTKAFSWNISNRFLS